MLAYLCCEQIAVVLRALAMSTEAPIKERISAREHAVLRAAAYVRKSTDQQQFSIENQLQAISEYALSRNIAIVRTYSDPGRSGLTIEGRDGLQQLIADVENGDADFSRILVYDVSRWGRFQDMDESAHFEFICKKAGVSVEYCAEEFQNDGSMMGALIKAIKRVMAAEYSRELSAKVARAKIRLACMGFHQGGTPGFGLRRMLVDRNRYPKCVLKAGELKNLHDDRVVLVPGPKNEIEIVRDVFRMYNEMDLTSGRIAQILNNQNSRTERGNNWDRSSVRGLLRNERYVGNAVYNTSSMKLGLKRIPNPRSQWTRTNGAIKPIIKEEMFSHAQWRLSGRFKTDWDLLNHLTAVWCVAGYLSLVSMKSVPKTPTANTYTDHFGSLRNAYRLVGYWESHSYRYPGLEGLLCRTDRKIICDLTSSVQQQGGTIQVHPVAGTLQIDGKTTVRTFVIPFTKRFDRKHNKSYGGWRIQLNQSSLYTDLILIVRMSSSNTKILDYHLIPFKLVAGRNLRLTNASISLLAQYRLKSLSNFYSACHICTHLPPSLEFIRRLRQSKCAAAINAAQRDIAS